MDTSVIIENLQTIVKDKIDAHINYLLTEIENTLHGIKIDLYSDLCDDIQLYIEDKLENIELAENNELNDLVRQLNNKPTQNNNIIKILQFAGIKNYQLQQQNGTLTITIKE